ncbi:MAG: tRNA (cytidine(56)-2'-O)-methyltransferase [Candidatus Caldarchaeum sp.]|nr:tRNA (cytidine(56)-2'-O)-methyltransferase [Candidatus Caldarchaeum sp.]
MIAVLRLGHRVERDKRLTSHVGLVARAFGADIMYYSGDRDATVEQTVLEVSRNWGGSFKAEYVESWRTIVKRWEGLKIHLTMYGIPLKQVVEEIRAHYKKGENLLVVVGGEKVDAEVFRLADYNVSITSQPHSEAAALAVFLDWLFEGEELDKAFSDARLQVEPMAKGKKLVRH